MSTLKNKVQLIGNVGNAPEIKNLESGKKVPNFSIATNEFYKTHMARKYRTPNGTILWLGARLLKS